MSKFCQNCGAAMEDEEVFCASCGTKNEEEAAAVAAKPPMQKLIALAAGALVLVIILCIVLGGGGYKQAFKNVVAVQYKGKVNKIDDLAPKQYWEYMEDEYDFDMDDYKDEYEENWEETEEYLEDEYGKNIRVTLKVEDKKVWKRKKVKKVADALNDQYDIKESSVKKVIEVDGEITIKGSEDDRDEDVDDLTFIKIGSKWYMVNIYEDDGDYRVSFVR